VKKDLCEAVSSDDYRSAAERIGSCGNSISHERAAQIAERVGREVHRELFGPEAMVCARSHAPANPPDLMIIQPDGSRYRTNEADTKGKVGREAADDTVPADAADGPSEAESAFGEVGPRERDRGWRENKVGVVIRAERGSVGPEGEWNPPREVVKTYVATTGDVHAFGRDLRTEAERRGLEKAKEVVFVSDNGHGIPSMIGREFADRELERVTDFEHARERIEDAARIVCGEDDRRRLALYFGWKSLLWNGKADEVTRAMSREAKRLAPRPEKLPALADGSPERALWSHVFYFEKWQGTMDYPEYRRRGWPLASSSVESACGQIGERVKHARMRWTRRRAQAVHQIKAALLSGDGRWDARWPGPIPVLETPDLTAIAPAA
jgi:hypothetical protein